jgi:hypothetical protein
MRALVPLVAIALGVPGTLGAAPPERSRVRAPAPHKELTHELQARDETAEPVEAPTPPAAPVAAQRAALSFLDEVRSFGMIALLKDEARAGRVATAPREEWTQDDPPRSLSFDEANSEHYWLQVVPPEDTPFATLDRVSTVGRGDGDTESFGVRPPGDRAPVAILRDGAISVTGRLSPDSVRRIVQAEYGRFRTCYEPALRAQPSARGRVVVRFVVGEDGAVQMSSDGGSDFPDENVVACITRAFMSLSFPPAAGGPMNVVYPLVIEPAR